MEYTPPKISLEKATEEYEIEFTKNDLTILYGLTDILESGVEKVSLKNENGKINIGGDFKQISCKMVQVESISDKGNCLSKTDAKNRIEAGMWYFPCPDYKYSNIKRNLEKSICDVFKIQDCKVKSFLTDIIDYAEN